MKNNTVIVIVAIVAIVLGIQFYMLIKLNSRLNQLSELNGQIETAQFKIPTLPNLDPPKPDPNNQSAWNPYSELQRMQSEMEQMFGDSFSRFHMNMPVGSLSKAPDVDLQEKPDRYRVTVNAPGADESSLKVKLDDQLLRISVKTEQAKDEGDDKKSTYQFRERFVGEFERVIRLPEPVQADKMTTDYHNGVLTITIPKKTP